MSYGNILDRFKDRKILVIGDIILDRYIWGRVERISPEAPVPVVEVTSDNFMLGGAANVANNIVALGGRATVIGVAGHDSAGNMLRSLLSEKGIDYKAFDDKRPTTIKTRVIAHNQQVVRFDRESTEKLDGKILKELLRYIKKAVDDHDAVIVSDYKKGVVSEGLIKEVVISAKPNKLVALDPKVGHFHLYKGAGVITPNLMEASKGSGIEIKDRDSLLKAGAKLLKQLKLTGVLITMGEEGMGLFEKGRATNIPTFARKVYDVTGAGDTVIATFVMAYASGATFLESAVLANHAAGIVVAQVGTATASVDDIKKSMTGFNEKGKFRPKILFEGP